MELSELIKALQKAQQVADAEGKTAKIYVDGHTIYQMFVMDISDVSYGDNLRNRNELAVTITAFDVDFE